MTEANSLSWKREGAKADLRMEDFWLGFEVEADVEVLAAVPVDFFPISTIDVGT